MNEKYKHRMIDSWRGTSSLILVGIVIGILTIWNQFGYEDAVHTFRHTLLDDMIIIGVVFAVFACSEYVRIPGDLLAHPTTVVGFNLMAILLSSVLTTGGSAILLGVLLVNSLKERQYPLIPILSFSWVGCNIAGSFSSLGDGPLLLLPVRGVDFLWPSINLTAGQLTLALMVTLVMWAIDFFLVYPKEEIRYKKLDRAMYVRPYIDLGQSWPFLFLLMLVPFVFKFLSGWTQISTFLGIGILALIIGRLKKGEILATEIADMGHPWWFPIRELAGVLTVLMFVSAPIGMYIGYHPEIFVDLGIDTPFEYNMAITALSATIDNAPASLRGIDAAQAAHKTGTLKDASPIVKGVDIPNQTLKAIEKGSINGGALSSVGNFAQIVFLAICTAKMGRRRIPNYFVYLGVSLVVLLPLIVLTGYLIP